MTVLLRCRVEKEALQKANRVAKELGTTLDELVTIFVTRMAKTGRVPLPLDRMNDELIAGSWMERAERVESFYDQNRAW